TANCMLARQPISGPSYLARLKGGVLGDGVSCMIAATFSAFPNTTFAQNNGVIQLTGVASRYVGLYIGAVLFVLGLFPHIGAIVQQIPKPVLGGATLVMFGSVAAAGGAHSGPVAARPTQHADHCDVIGCRSGHCVAACAAASIAETGAEPVRFG
ncbi:xanthine/uracil permease family protein, partial [Pseudomonas syringae pv. pisi str. 1704B]